MILKLVKSARVYLWPLITANVLAVSWAVDGLHPDAIFLGVALCLLASFGFVLNDIFDRSVDHKNQAGRLEAAPPELLRLAKGAAVGLVSLGLLVSSLVGLQALGFALVVAVGLTLYTVYMRSWLVVSTALAACLSMSPLVGPVILFGASFRAFHLYVLAAAWLVLFGREVLLDVKDVAGDQAGGRATLATTMGASRGSRFGVTIILAGAVFLAVVLVSSAPPLTGLVGMVILACVAIPGLRLVMHSGRGFASLVWWSRLGMLLLSLAIVLEKAGL